MKIIDILKESMVMANLQATNKRDLLHEMAAQLSSLSSEVHSNTDEILAALIGREALGSTGVGEGVAIPHAKMAGLKNLVACFGRAFQGVPFDAVDNQPVKLIFVLLVPENSAGAHLKALARISRLLKNSELRQRLLEFTTSQALYQCLMDEDAQA